MGNTDFDRIIIVLSRICDSNNRCRVPIWLTNEAYGLFEGSLECIEGMSRISHISSNRQFILARKK